MQALVTTIEEIRTEKSDDRALLSIPDALRARFFAFADPERQKALGQFLTPPHVADLMAEMFRLRVSHMHVLDAGAGLGILSSAFVRRQLLKKNPPKQIEVTAYELDQALVSGLEETYETCRVACQNRDVQFSATIRNADFIAEGAEMLRNDFFSKTPQTFDAAIVNPPYGKLATTSDGYRLLRAVGAETTNMYTAFLNLVIGLLKPYGELVAITPRSFCNGPYFKSFRRNLLKEMSFRRIHVFESRVAAFKHDNVLQENVILYAVKHAKPPRTIRISQSGGDVDAVVHTRILPAGEIVAPSDPEAFIHIPITEQHLAASNQMSQLGRNRATRLPAMCCSLFSTLDPTALGKPRRPRFAV